MRESPILKANGAKWYHSDDHYSPNLSKASLGNFFYEALRIGAQIGEIWPFVPHYVRSPVYVSIFMTEEMKNYLEQNTKFKFRDPPKIHLN